MDGEEGVACGPARVAAAPFGHADAAGPYFSFSIETICVTLSLASPKTIMVF
jgi:hypothetical protein